MYTISKQSHILVLSDTPYSKYWSLRDRLYPSKAKSALEQYIQNAHTVFMENTIFLGNFKKKFTQEDESHLKRMFELLIDARKVWEDEFR